MERCATTPWWFLFCTLTAVRAAVAKAHNQHEQKFVPDLLRGGSHEGIPHDDDDGDDDDDVAMAASAAAQVPEQENIVSPGAS